MKWLFFILLLANMGLLVWISPQGMGSESEVDQTSKEKTLLLLREIDEAALESSRKAEEVAEINSQADWQTEPALPVEEEFVQSEAAPDQNEEEAEKISEAEFPVPVALGEIEDEAPPSIKAEPKEIKELPIEVASQPETEPEPILQCGSVGPVSKRAQADQLSLRLRALGLQPELNTELRNDQEGYWVLVPPQKNRRTAIKIVQRLKEAGVTDLWRFTSGDLAHAISLGLFRNESRAEIRRKSIADKGFEAEVRPRYRQKTLYWLSFSYAGDSPLKEDKWNQLEELYPTIEQRIVDCQEIATQ